MCNLAIYDKVTYLEHLTKTYFPYFELKTVYIIMLGIKKLNGSFVVDNVVKSLFLPNFALVVSNQSALVESQHQTSPSSSLPSISLVNSK